MALDHSLSDIFVVLGVLIPARLPPNFSSRSFPHLIGVYCGNLRKLKKHREKVTHYLSPR